MRWRQDAVCGAPILAAVGLCCFALAAATDTPSSFQHEVMKGESISLVCITYYGHYTGVMGEAIMKLNPGMGNINSISVGQRIRLPFAGEPTEEPQAPRQLFEKRMDIVQGVVTFTRGEAYLTPHSGNTKSRLSANSIVYPGDVIETGPNGRVEIIVNSESVVRMRENGRLVLDAFREPEKKVTKTSITFLAGTLWTKVKRATDRVSRFELELPTAVAGVRGTVYETMVAADSSAEIKVFSGEVAVKNREPSAPAPSDGAGEVAGPQEVAGPREVSFAEWVHIVRSMQKIAIDNRGKARNPTSFARNPSDSWEQWNEERDARVARLFSEPL